MIFFVSPYDYFQMTMPELYSSHWKMIRIQISSTRALLTWVIRLFFFAINNVYASVSPHVSNQECGTTLEVKIPKGTFATTYVSIRSDLFNLGPVARVRCTAVDSAEVDLTLIYKIVKVTPRSKFYDFVNQYTIVELEE